MTSGCENQWGLHPSEAESCWSPGVPLRGPARGRACSHTHSIWDPEQGSSSQSARDIQGGTKLTHFRARAAGVGATLSEDRSAGRGHCSFAELSHPAGLTQVDAISELSINLANGVPRPPAPRNSHTQPELPPAAFPQ